jgi:hypothetical protein
LDQRVVNEELSRLENAASSRVAESAFEREVCRNHSETRGWYLRVEGGGPWEGFRASRRSSRDTYPESNITEYVLIYEDKQARLGGPSGVASPITTNHAAKGSVFVKLSKRRRQLKQMAGLRKAPCLSN